MYSAATGLYDDGMQRFDTDVNAEPREQPMPKSALSSDVRSLLHRPAPLVLIAVVLCSIVPNTAPLCSGQETNAAQARQQRARRPPNPAMQPIEDVAGLPRVLLIGDSISIGYTVPTRNELKGTANVHRPLTNCGPTTRGLEQIDRWLGDRTWDVIHFNFGLHDLKFMGRDGGNLADPNAEGSHRQVELEAYEENLDRIVARLKKTGAKLIWRNTTPVPPGCQGRITGDELRYNEAAARVMKKYDVATHDLYTFAFERMEQLMRKENVHFTPDGSKALAVEVARVISAALPKKDASPESGETPASAPAGGKQ